MNTATADQLSLIDDAPKAQADAVPDFALVIHLAATRFGSPAGIAFLPAFHLPDRLRLADRESPSFSVPEHQQIRR